MAKVSEITEPYFSHDIAARGDEKILKMFFAFRKLAKTIERDELETLAALGSYGLFWSVVEYMHRNTLSVNDLDVIADDLRVPEKFVRMVLDDFELFRKEGDAYISDRILKNIDKQQEKSSSNSKAARARWTLAKLKTDYIEIFGIEPALSDKSVAAFLKYSDTIPDFKDKIADILYTLQGLKFENNPKFNPNIDWLLEDNHMTKLVNGEYGKLKSWKAEKERRKIAEESKKLEEQKLAESVVDIDSIHNRVDAVDILVKNSSYISIMNKLIVPSNILPLLKKFDIDADEIKNLKKKEMENV